MSAHLPEHIRERIRSFPANRMGARKVALIMKDGSVVEDVLVAWGEVVRIGGAEGCPVDLHDVVDVENRS